MKVIYIHSGIFPSSSPSETFVFYNALGLSSVFDEVYLLLCKNDKRDLETLVKDRLKIDIPNNLIIKTFPSFWIKRTHKLLFKSYYSYISKLSKEIKIDALITRNTNFLPYLVKLKVKCDLKIYYETHDFYLNLKSRDDIDIKRKKRYEKLERKYLPSLNGIFCLTNNQLNLYKENLPEQNYILARTGVIKRNISNNQKKYITYVGSFDNIKGLDVLINAAKLIESDYKFLLIGGQSKKKINSVKELIDKKELTDKFVVEGWLEKAKLESYLSKTLIGILPLKNTFFNRYLTSPLKLFDYFSFKIPVIASDIPNLRELIKEDKTGLFFDAGNSEDLASKIHYLVKNPTKIEDMRKEIEEFNSQFYWENRAKIIYDAIKNF